MSNVITDSFNITVNGVTKNSLTDYGWALENRFDCIGQPVKQSSVVSVPFGKTYDLANALNGGEPYFVSRPITLKLGVKKENENWRDYISDLRNTYEGREVKIKFDGDTWEWTGTAYIQETESTRQDCRFDLFIDADAYKYSTIIRVFGGQFPVPVALPVETQYAIKGEQIYFSSANSFSGTLTWNYNGIAKTETLNGTYSDYAVPDLIAGQSDTIRLTSSVFTGVSFKYDARSL
jgi:hypothetical protein